LTRFRKAIDTHVKSLKDATYGQGFDRHFLGLRCMMEANESSDFFKNPLFSESGNYRLSTSNMSPGDKFYGGFGPVVGDGYGINYAIGKDDMKFSISHKLSAKTTNAYAFRDALERTMIDMMILFPKR